MNPQIEFLYSFEKLEAYEQSCAAVFAKYAPQTPEENHLVSNIAVAVWLRRRAASVMHAILRQLKDVQEAPAADALVLVQLTRSLVRFNREYRHHKKHISGCRGALKRLRVEGSYELPGSNVIEFPTPRKEMDRHDSASQRRAA